MRNRLENILQKKLDKINYIPYYYYIAITKVVLKLIFLSRGIYNQIHGFAFLLFGCFRPLFRAELSYNTKLKIICQHFFKSFLKNF